jgi:GT2 family glycosyltransferase
VLTELGGLDPDFFLYYEDIDLCRRARQGGWSVWFDPSAAIVHHRPLHSRRVPPHLRLVTRHALLTYARKHWPAWQLPLLGGIVRLEAAARGLLAWCRGDARARRTFAELGRLVGEVLGGRADQAWARLTRVVRTQEQHLAATFLDRHPVPQPPRPAAGLPGQRPPVRAAGHGRAGGR